MNLDYSSYEHNLWERWNKEEDEAVLNEIIEYYMYLVQFHVERIASHLPSSVSKDDINSFGLLGLYDAINKFETDRNLKFDTYASFRIKGAIIDGLRKEDWLPRTLREKTKKVEKVTNQLEQELQRSPTSEEIANELDMTKGEVESVVKDALFSNVMSIEEKPKNQNEFTEGIGYTIPDDDSLQPEEEMVQQELEKDLVEGIRALNKNEQMVISLFYNEELTLTEIGQVLGLTTSRISQIHKKAIYKLKNILTKL
ncbi:FliA/WhiG family RNA polymerase sigma factor [Oceanobacillus sp. CAU 1775]